MKNTPFTVDVDQNPTPLTVSIVPTAAPSEMNDCVGPAVFAAVSSAEALSLALSPAQRKAIELLTSGHTLVATATAAGVSRMTLYRWLKGDAAFVAAFNAWQQDVLDTARGRLLALSDLAVTTVAKAMSRGDARIAMRVLDSVGVLDRPKPGSTDSDEIERVQKLERMKSHTKLKQAETQAEIDSCMAV